MTRSAWCLATAAVLGCGGEPRDVGLRKASAGTPAPPTAVADTTPRFAQVSAGDEFTCAITVGGTAYCWGSNEGGRLGSGTAKASSATPMPVAKGLTFTTISAGREHACALAPDGRAYCWGYSPEGALGVPAATSGVPVPVATELRFSSLSAGNQRSCAVTVAGALYCWGRFSRPSSAPAGLGGPQPIRVDSGGRFRSVSAGLGHACALSSDGRVYCWGTNNTGELGAGRGVASPSSAPVPVTLADSVIEVSASSVGACAVTARGTAHSWGTNWFGQLGNGASTERYQPNPAPVEVTGGHRWKQVSAGGGQACGLTVEGAAYCWGAGPLLGNPAAPDRCDGPPPRDCSTRPIAVSGAHRFRQISAGGTHTCAVTLDGEVYCWGENLLGQLGNATTRAVVEPVRVGPGRAAAAGGKASRPPLQTLQLHPIKPLPIPGGEPARTGGKASASIQISLHGAVAEAVITDPLGRRLGYEPATGQALEEIPQASYDSSGLGTLAGDSIVDDRLWKEIYLYAPVDGDYVISIIGTRAGPYTLAVGGYDVRRRSAWLQPKDVPISPGERHGYRFRFSSADAGIHGLLASGQFSGGDGDSGDALLTYARPVQARTALGAGATGFVVLVFYATELDPATFRAELNGTSLAALFHAAPGMHELVRVPARRGENLLVLTAQASAGGSVDRDELQFTVP